LGASPRSTLKRVGIPLIGMNIVAGGILAFAFAMLEVSDSLILAQQAEHYPVTKAIYSLLSTLGTGHELASALGVWAMVFLGVAIMGAFVVLGKRAGSIISVLCTNLLVLYVPRQWFYFEYFTEVKILKRWNIKRSACLLCTLYLASVLSSFAKDPPISQKLYDFTAGDKLPQNASHDWTLGPTGARGWCQVGKGLGAAGNTAPARQILITSVKQGTPAGKVLKKGDVILGIGEKPFDRDARITFAKAIGEAELQRFRDGEVSNVKIVLPKLPAFSATAPYQCEKSEILLEGGCKALSKQGIGNSGIPSDLNALALLATGNKKYRSQVANYVRRRASKRMSPETGLPCWHFAFKNILLCEYYLVTKDKKVLPEIKHLTQHLVSGRGPLSTWGHSFVDPSNQRLRGYGAVNAVGVPVVMSIALAKECGVEVKDLDKTLADSAQFFRRHVGLGAIPYGDGPPTTKHGHDDNGKNSAAALFFNLLGDDVATRYYARTAMAAYGGDREQGHTGNFFNMLWSLPAVALGGPESTGMWLKEFGWYYDLARDSEHRYRYQGYPNEKSNNVHVKWNCPGAYLLHFALAKKQLRITGRKPACITRFNNKENVENIRAGRMSYHGASVETLKEALSLWSPVARMRAEKEVRRRKLFDSINYGLDSRDPLERTAAVKALSNFKECARMLGDRDLRVRLTALRTLAKLDKPRAVDAVFRHLVKVKKEDPVFTQNIGDTFFPLGSSTKRIGSLLAGIKDRKIAMAGIRILLNDEDALVASRMAMGLTFLPKKEQRELLPDVYQKLQNLPVGNVMFVNRLRVSGVECLAQWELQEGLDLAVELLADESWGRNSRLPGAAAVVKGYGGNAKSALPKLTATHQGYASKGNQKWKDLLKETIDAVKESSSENKKLKTLESVR